MTVLCIILTIISYRQNKELTTKSKPNITASYLLSIIADLWILGTYVL